MTDRAMFTVLNVHKRRGETPLACLTRLQAAVPELRELPLTYAGRLDPLAEGVLIVLVGEEAKRKDLYLGLRKKYCLEVLFGFATDSYDVAGKLTALRDERIATVPLMDAVGKLEGVHAQPYPPYSSKPVGGKPLFAWAREDRLHEITIPSHEVTIYRSLLRHSETISGGEIEASVAESLTDLLGDFRQDEIRACWHAHMHGRRDTLYDVATLEIECSSGTYMRSIAHELGAALGVPALAFRIVRIEVGMYTLKESVRDFEKLSMSQPLV